MNVDNQEKINKSDYLLITYVDIFQKDNNYDAYESEFLETVN